MPCTEVAQSTPAVVESVSPGEILELLAALGFRGTMMTDGTGEPCIQFMVEGLGCLVLFYGYTDGQARSIQFGAQFDEPVPLERINAWNCAKRYLKVTRTEEGHTRLALDADLDGGVTRAWLAEQVLTWSRLLVRCIRTLSE